MLTVQELNGVAAGSIVATVVALYVLGRCEVGVEVSVEIAVDAIGHLLFVSY